MHRSSKQSGKYLFPWREGNQFRLLVDSEQFYPQMLQAIKTAKHYILLEMYLVKSGRVSDLFISALMAAAERGTKVYLLIDDFGALEFNQADRNRLALSDVTVSYYNPLKTHPFIYFLRILWKKSTPALNRDHRKLLLVDGVEAFVGGAGITDEYEAMDSSTSWRDTMIHIQGHITQDWQRLFLQTWNRINSTPLSLPETPVKIFEPGQAGRVTISDAHQRTGTQRSLNKRIYKSNHRVWFCTAYFIPSWTLRRRLIRAALNGVDVRLLLPGPHTDHPGARYTSQYYYGRLLRNGVRIFEYQPRFLHAKTVLCDQWVTIGSCNFDRWNLTWNLEANQEVDDPLMAQQTRDMFEQDLNNCQEITHEAWRNRKKRTRVMEWFWRKVESFSIRLKQNSKD